MSQEVHTHAEGGRHQPGKHRTRTPTKGPVMIFERGAIYLSSEGDD